MPPPSGTPFDAFHQLLREQVAAIVEAELLVDSARAERHRALLRQGRVRPRVIGCQPALPEPDPSPGAQMPMWLVYEHPPVKGVRAFVAFDPEHQTFGLGTWEGHTAWYRGGQGSLLDLLEQVEQLVARSAGDEHTGLE